jgi:hypothetical protein
MTAAEKLARASTKYRRAYDRLYVRSMQAGSAEESARIDAALARINAEYDAAKREVGA